MSDLDLRDAVDRAIKALEPVSRYRAVNGDDWPALKVRPVLDMLRAALAQPQDRPRTEQDAWEEWAQTTRPSGDVDEVQRKWLASAERAAFLEESEQTQAQAEPAAWWVPSFSEPLVGIGPKKPMLWPEAQPLYSNQPAQPERQDDHFPDAGKMVSSQQGQAAPTVETGLVVMRDKVSRRWYVYSPEHKGVCTLFRVVSGPFGDQPAANAALAGLMKAAQPQAEPVAWLRVSNISEIASGAFLPGELGGVELRSERLVPLVIVPGKNAS